MSDWPSDRAGVLDHVQSLDDVQSLDHAQSRDDERRDHVGAWPVMRRRRWGRWVAAATLIVGAAVAVPVGIGAVHDVRGPAAAASPNGVAPEGVGDVRHLTVQLRSAITRAIAAAKVDGVTLSVTSGYRSKAQQQQLYVAAIAKYGSPEAARQWVLPPDESAHVRGEAVDVGPTEGARWLRENGERFGLCQRYANESWHFERLAGAKGSVCPALEPHA
jgi:hypothetical protein